MHPIREGIIHDVNMMEYVWNYAFHEELRCDPAEFNVIVTDTCDANHLNRLKMTEIAFEVFRVSGFYISIS